ncbi:MAG: hypothetical protein JRH20_10690 [Deltaproteobacteria bacterium]|nr:hypothetical protein [Deltaproteobacteria bacterium]
MSNPALRVMRSGKRLPPLSADCQLKIANMDGQQAMLDYQSAGTLLLRTNNDAMSLSGEEREALREAVCRLGSRTIVALTQMQGYVSFVVLAGRRERPLYPAPSTKKQGPTQRTILAVFDLEDRESVLPKAESDKLADYLATRLAEQRSYRVIPREQLRKRLVGERKKSYRVCYDSSCQIELGKSLAAQAVVNIRLLKLGESCTLTAKIYELKSETTQAAASSKGACTAAALQEVVDRLAERLSRD